MTGRIGPPDGASRPAQLVAFESSMVREWDDFVHRQPNARYCHLSGFKQAVEATYGYTPNYCALRADDSIVGVLPFFLIAGLNGRRMVSQPFQDYGGFLFDTSLSATTLDLQKWMDELLALSGARYLELRGASTVLPMALADTFLRVRLHHCAELYLDDTQALWRNSAPSVRKNVNRALMSNLVCYNDTGYQAIEARFYPLYLNAMRKFGTPPHPLDFFLNLARYLGESMKLLLVDHRDKTIAALLGFRAGKRLYLTTSVSDERYLSIRPNDLAHWETIKWACNAGLSSVDFGPVRYEGQRRFKEKWGCRFFDYEYWYYPSDIGKKILKTYTEPTMVNKIWSLAVPTWIGRRIGKYIRRELGR